MTRNPRRRRSPYLLAAALCLSGLAAQDRDLVAGRVLDRDGNPWAGAKVTLAALPMPAAPELGEIDRVEVEASPSGIFRAKILPDLSYVAWVAVHATDGQLRTTDPVRGVRPGVTLELAEAEPFPAPRLVVRGLDAWADHGPFRVALHSSLTELGVVTLELDAEGVATLPAWPRTALFAEIRGGDGQPLHLARVRSPRRTSGGRQSDPDVRIPPPHPLPVVVRNADGEPIAGARIRHQVGSIRIDDWVGAIFGTVERRFWREGPCTDGTGRATIEIPSAYDPLDPEACDRFSELFVETVKDGFARSHSGLNRGEPFVDGRRILGPDAKRRRAELPFTLVTPRPIRGKLESESGLPLCDHPVLLTMSSKVAGGGRDRIVPRRFLVTTGEDGVYTLADPPRDAHDVRFHFLIPAAQQTAWAAGVAGPLCRTAMTMQPYDAVQGTFPDVTLSRLRSVQVSIRNRGAGPKPRRTVTVIPIGTDRVDRDALPDLPWLTTTDASGRLALRLPPGRYGLLSLEATSFVAAEFDVGPQRTPLELDVAARDYGWMRLNVETPDGPAVAGQAVPFWTSWGDVHQPAPMEAALAELAPELVRSARIEDGRLDIRFFPHLPNVEVQMRIHLADGRTSQEIKLGRTTERMTLRID